MEMEERCHEGTVQLPWVCTKGKELSVLAPPDLITTFTLMKHFVKTLYTITGDKR